MDGRNKVENLFHTLDNIHNMTKNKCDSDGCSGKTEQRTGEQTKGKFVDKSKIKLENFISRSTNKEGASPLNFLLSLLNPCLCPLTCRRQFAINVMMRIGSLFYIVNGLSSRLQIDVNLSLLFLSPVPIGILRQEGDMNR